MARPRSGKNTKPSTARLPRSLIVPRRRITKPIYVKLTASQKKARHDEAERKRRAIKNDMKIWLDEIQQRSRELEVKHNRSSRFFLNMLFQNSVHLTKTQAKTNPWNAWKSQKALELKEAGEEAMDVEQIVEAFSHEYESLSDKDKQRIVDDYEARRQVDELAKIQFPTLKSRIRSTAELISAVVELLKVAKLRCGVEAMFLMVRSDPQPFMEPKWFFTNPNWNEFLKIIARHGWDPKIIGAKLEAFSIAGCDPQKMLQTADDQAKWYKSLIREEALKKLLEAINDGSPVKIELNAVPYEKFDRLVTLRYGVVVKKWPFAKFENPSKMSSAVQPLKDLYNGLRNGSIGFEKLSDNDWEQWKEDYDEGVKDGTIEVKTRQVRSDCGKKRGPQKRKQAVGGDGVNGNEERPDHGKKRGKKRAADGDRDVDVAEPVAKKSKTSSKPNHRVSKFTSANLRVSIPEDDADEAWEDEEEWEGIVDRGGLSKTTGTRKPNGTSNTSSKPNSSLPSTTSQDDNVVMDEDGEDGPTSKEANPRHTPSSSHNASTTGLPTRSQRDLSRSPTPALTRVSAELAEPADAGDGTATRSGRVPHKRKETHYGGDWPGPRSGSRKTKRPAPKPVGKACEDQRKRLGKRASETVEGDR